jgi:hypothetical protein
MQVQASTTNITIICPFTRTNYTSSSYLPPALLSPPGSCIVHTMFLEPDWYEKLCDALPRPVHQQRPKPSTDALYHNPKGPVTSSITAVSGKRWAPCTFSVHQQHPALSISQLTRSPPKPPPSPARTRVASTIAQMLPNPTNGMSLDCAPAAAAVRRSTDHAQDAPGALVPACPGQAATGAPCALATPQRAQANAAAFLTTDVRDCLLH